MSEDNFNGRILEELVYSQRLTKGHIKKLSDAMMKIDAEGMRCSDTLLTCVQVLETRITTDMFMLTFKWQLYRTHIGRTLGTKLIETKINTVDEIRNYLTYNGQSDFDIINLKGHLFNAWLVKKVIDYYKNYMLSQAVLDNIYMLIEKLPTLQLKTYCANSALQNFSGNSITKKRFVERVRPIIEEVKGKEHIDREPVEQQKIF